MFNKSKQFTVNFEVNVKEKLSSLKTSSTIREFSNKNGRYSDQKYFKEININL